MRGMIVLAAIGIALLGVLIYLGESAQGAGESKAQPGNTLSYRVAKLERRLGWAETLIDVLIARGNGDATCFAGWVDIQREGSGGEPVWVEVVTADCIDKEFVVPPPGEQTAQPTP
jgi:hypothetical protein